jgi:sensor c-di-GMP phosphodiesterase-like protein
VPLVFQPGEAFQFDWSEDWAILGGEGIEEAAFLAFLKGIGCDYAQGYFVSRPLSAKDLAKRVGATVAQAA